MIVCGLSFITDFVLTEAQITGKPPKGVGLNSSNSLINGMIAAVHFYSDGSAVNLVSGGLPLTLVGSSPPGSSLDGGSVRGLSDLKYYKIDDSSQTMDPGLAPFSIEIDISPVPADFSVHRYAGGNPVARGVWEVDGWNIQTPGGGGFQMELNNSTNPVVVNTQTIFNTSTGGPFTRGLFISKGAGSTPQWWVNGNKVPTHSNFGGMIVPTMTKNSSRPVTFGTYQFEDHHYEGSISRFIYWNRALTDNEAATVSSINSAQAYSYMSGSTSPTSTPTPSPSSGPTPTPTISATPSTPLKGDINNDKIVNSLDWSIMNGRWFTSDIAADLNSDGIVNSLDFSIMNGNWLKSV